MLYRIVINPNQKQQEQVNLTDEQQHYLKRVLRLKEGDKFTIMDGKGRAWIAQLQETAAQILEPLIESRELPVELTLMVSLPKGNGFEDILRNCTELGVTTFVPVLSQRTLLNPSSSKIARWRKIVTEATEQCQRQRVPEILEPIKFTQALIKVKKIDTQGYICVTRKEKHLLTYLQPPIVKNLVIATGPEGGWTTHEIQEALNMDFLPVSLGRRILRAVTAPVCAVSLITAILETEITPFSQI